MLGMGVRRWRERSLRARLLFGGSLLLLVFGALSQYSAMRRMADEYQDEIALETDSTLDFFAMSVLPLVRAGNETAIQDMLRTQATRRRIREVVWQGETGRVLHIMPRVAQSVPPMWFRVLADINAPPGIRKITVGDRLAGIILVRLNPLPWENRLWRSVAQQGVYQAIDIGLLLALILFVVSRTLYPLHELANAMRRFAQGDLAARGTLPAGALPEVHDMVGAINQAADSIQVLVRSLSEQRRATDNAALVMELDPDGRITYLNERFCSTLGYTQQEMQGRLPDAFYVPGEHYFDHFRSAIQKLPVWCSELAYRAKSGEEIWTDITVTPFLDAQGNPLKYIAIHHDITARRHMEQALRDSEEKFRTLVENTQDWFFEIDAHGRFTYSSPRIYEMLGYRAEEILGKHPRDLMPPDEAERVSQVFQGLAAQHAPLTLLDNVNLHKDGRRVILETSAIPIFDAQGKYAGYRGVDRDITMRKMAERELEQSRDALREFSAHLQQARENEKIKIAREIHDELGGTLTALKMDAFWLSSKLPADLGALRQKSQAMLELIDSAIHATRRIVTELRPTILEDLGLLAAIQWQAREFESRTGIACTLHFPPAEPAVDEACATALFRILQEALTNVAKHARAAAVEVCYASDSEAVTLTIQDDGRGISQDAMNDPTHHGIRGMFERARYLNGKARVEPGFNKGTVVIVRLPRDPSSDTLPT